MKNPSITPSSAIIARADTPIDVCVRMMRDHEVGSILIVNDTTSQQLVGIFTERDLMMKFDQIENEALWKKPVRTVMSKSVYALDVSEIGNAGDFMVAHGFRHVPIVMSDEKSKERLVGVVSMRDLFRQLLFESEAVAADKPRKKIGNIGVISVDPDFIRLFEKGLPENLKPQISRMSLESALMESDKTKALLFDIDHINRKEWSALLKYLNHSTLAPYVILVFNPTLYESRIVKVLEKLGSASNISVFEKPVALAELLMRVRTSLVTGNPLSRRESRTS